MLNGQITETKYTYFSVDCKSYPYATYSLQHGLLSLPKLSTTVPAQNNFTVNEVECEPCPTGNRFDFQFQLLPTPPFQLYSVQDRGSDRLTDPPIR